MYNKELTVCLLGVSVLALGLAACSSGDGADGSTFSTGGADSGAAGGALVGAGSSSSGSGGALVDAGGSGSGGSGTATTDPLEYVPCTLDVSKIDTSKCDSTISTGCDGADIAHNYVLFPDPYACYNDCAAGVTLLKGSKCQRDGVVLTWDEQDAQCVLNGQGYPIEQEHGCGNGVYTDGLSADAYKQRVAAWYDIAKTHATPSYESGAGADAYVVDLTLENGDKIQAAMSMGHGVLDGKCGSTFLVKVDDKYVLLLQTDVRAWSLELSPGANTWLDPTNVGGGCTIPDVRKIDPSFVIDQFQ